MGKMKNSTKIILAVVGVVAVGGAAWFMLRRKNPEDDGHSPGDFADAVGKTAPPIKIITPPKSFPLTVGSNNSYVGKLQTALKVTADNKFGPVTKQALIDQAGVSSVANEVQLNDIITKINSAAAAASSKSRAVDLVTKFMTGKYSIQGVVTKQWNKVTEDAFGALVPSNGWINIYKGTKYNNADYILKTPTKLGNIVIEVTRGDSKGTYMGDPATITLVA